MMGNAFSPYWARARRRDPNASSLDFSTLNVALTAPGQSWWSLTERKRCALQSSATSLRIGPSQLAWSGGTLNVNVNEKTAPWGNSLVGSVHVTPTVWTDTQVFLDEAHEHTWRPFAPIARVTVQFTKPSIRFSGTGYLDHNLGACPLEESFDAWSWSRVSNERVHIAYDVRSVRGTTSHRAFIVDPENRLTTAPFGQEHTLPRTRFGLDRVARSEGPRVRIARTLEDGPFYARSVIETDLQGQPAIGVHEAVSLERFRSRWAQFLTPFRMRVEKP